MKKEATRLASTLHFAKRQRQHTTPFRTLGRWRSIETPIDQPREHRVSIDQTNESTDAISDNSDEPHGHVNLLRLTFPFSKLLSAALSYTIYSLNETNVFSVSYHGKKARYLYVCQMQLKEINLTFIRHNGRAVHITVITAPTKEIHRKLQAKIPVGTVLMLFLLPMSFLHFSRLFPEKTTERIRYGVIFVGNFS